MKTFTISLDSNEIRQAAEDLRTYAEEFQMKCERFFDACADHGIKIAQMHEGDFGGYIVYSKRFETDGEEYTIYIVATDTPLTKTWYTSATGGKTKSATISPLLMAEFGSGWKALEEIPAGVNAGRGTLNTYGHADQPSWSWWTDNASDQTDAQMISSKNGRWLFKTSGIVPSRPLHEAVMSLVKDVEGIAISIFH